MRNFLGLVCAAGLFLAANEVRASYSIGIATSPAQDVTLGGGQPPPSGQSIFDVTFNDTSTSGSKWNYRNYQLLGVDSLGSSVSGLFSSLTVDSASTLKLGSGQNYLSGHTYTLIVDWTVANTAVPDPDGNGIYFNLFVKQPDGNNANAGATDTLNIQTVGVPEPSQIAASVLILCGFSAIVCVGRQSRRQKASC